MTAPTNHKHVMVDIETMGKGPRAAIVSIGAVPFSIHPERIEVGPIDSWFHERATLQSNIDAGRNVDPETIEWWLAQSKSAQDALLREPRHDLPVMLEAFRRWLTSSPGLRAETIWAKPPQFDVDILRNAFASQDVTWPFHYGATRDVRTVLELASNMNWSDVTGMEFAGEPHNAAHDAAHQALQVCLFHAKLYESRR